MKVILTKDVPEVGRAGTVLNVAPGFARNYLYPRGYALEATEGNMRQLELQRKKAEELAAQEREEAKGLAEQLEGVEVGFVLKAGELGQLYGSVSQANIAEALAEKGFDINKRQVLMREHIKRTGSIPVEIKVHGDIHARIKVNVEAEEDEEAKAAAEARAKAAAEVEEATRRAAAEERGEDPDAPPAEAEESAQDPAEESAEDETRATASADAQD